MARSTVAVRFSADTADLKRGLGDLDSQAGKAEKSLGGFSKTASLGLAAVGAGALAMGKSFVDAASESQKVTRQTEAVLKSMGDQAGVTADDVAELSDELSKKTGVDDELIQSGQNVLLTFGKVRNELGAGNDIFTRATQLALDMSVALGTDLSSANIQLGKALNDPITGITALTRSGVSFTEQQKEQIRTLVESGDTLGAQKIILSELDNQFAGSAEAQATASDKLGVAWGNLQEQIGGILLPVFEDLVGVGTDVLGMFESLPDPVQKVAVVGGTLVAGLMALGGTISFAADHLRNMKGNLGGLIPDLRNAEGGLTRMGTAVAGVGTALALVGIIEWAKGLDGATVDIDEFSAALTSSDQATREQAAGMLLLADRWGDLDDKIRETAETNLVGAERMVDAAEAAGVSAERIAVLRQIIDEQRNAAALAAVDQKTNAEAMREAQEAAEGETQALQDLATQLRAMFDPVFAAVNAETQLAQAQRDAATAARDHGAGSDEAKAANQRAVQAAMNYESALLGLGGAIDDGSTSLAGFRGKLDEWVASGRITREQANEIYERFRELNAQADRMDGRVVTVSYREVRGPRQGGAWGSATGGLVPQHLASGGIGGMHPGTPRGTDTVPAWLTPGEYVLNRGAARQLGRGVLERLNNGELPAVAAGGRAAAPIFVFNIDANGAIGLDTRDLVDLLRREFEQVWQRNGWSLTA